ncbi:uncharacterized protein FFC1_03615 [Fusarium fujikuroi]|nr:uncharacterized protein FFC1_03615 [Fusarium fujikuroi]
MQHYLSIY